MIRVFGDTSFYQSLLSRRDASHAAAVRLFDSLDAAIITTDYVLLELGALMSRGSARSVFTDFVQILRSDATTTVVPASRDLLDAGLVLFAGRPDKEWSLTDCISFVVMQREGITDALASDKHFAQAKFNLLLQG